MKCPECGAENPDGSKFCGLCFRVITYGHQNAPLIAEKGSIKEYAGKLEAPAKTELNTKASDPFRIDTNPPSFIATTPSWMYIRKKRLRALIASGVFIIAIAVCISLVFFLRQGEKKHIGFSTFTSKRSYISFSYPADWEKKGRDFLERFSKGNVLNPDVGNEIILVERGEGMFKHMLIVSSYEEDFGSTPWRDVESSLVSSVMDGVSLQGGEDLKFFDLEIPEDCRADTIGYGYISPSQSGPDVYMLEGYIHKAGFSYKLVLLTPLLAGRTEGEALLVFDNLARTVSLK